VTSCPGSCGRLILGQRSPVKSIRGPSVNALVSSPLVILFFMSFTPRPISTPRSCKTALTNGFSTTIGCVAMEAWAERLQFLQVVHLVHFNASIFSLLTVKDLLANFHLLANLHHRRTRLRRPRGIGYLLHAARLSVKPRLFLNPNLLRWIKFRGGRSVTHFKIYVYDHNLKFFIHQSD